MRKELWDIACDRWDEDDAKALYKVFSDYYDDEHWDEFCSLAFIGTDRDVDDFIFNEFLKDTKSMKVLSSTLTETELSLT